MLTNRSTARPLRLGRLLAAASCVALVAGCVSPQPRGELPFQDAPAFSLGTDEAAGAGDGLDAEGDRPIDRWWRSLGDAALNERIERALTNNYDLAAAWQRLSAARALARRAEADLYPDLDATAGASRQESLDSGSDQTTLSLGLAASYEVDLWGRIDSLAQAEALRARATEADYRAAAVSLSSSVALTWYQIAEARAQLDLVQSQLEVNQTFLSLLEERFDFGQLRKADLVRQEQLVEATREQAIVQRARLDLLEHQLAILEGRPPQSAGAEPGAALPGLPGMPRVGVPAELLQRRPDVRAALLRLWAADRDLAAAVSDQYPRLNLTASLETAGEQPGDLFEDWLLGIAGQAIAPLLDGGEREAEVERNTAVVRQLVAAYGQTVLQAFGEVEDALSRERRQAQRLASLNEQLRLAEQSVEEVQTQFLNGVGDYLAVLTALRDQQQLERDVLAARLDVVAARIALYRALAGGFTTPREREQDAQSEDDTAPAQPDPPQAPQGQDDA